MLHAYFLHIVFLIKFPANSVMLKMAVLCAACEALTQWAYGVKMTLYRRRCVILRHVPAWQFLFVKHSEGGYLFFSNCCLSLVHLQKVHKKSVLSIDATSMKLKKIMRSH